MILLLTFQASLITEYAAVVQPIQLAFQQQIQALKNQHEKFVTSLKQQQQACPAGPPAPPAEAEKAPAITTQPGKKISPTISLLLWSLGPSTYFWFYLNYLLHMDISNNKVSKSELGLLKRLFKA